MHQLKIENLHVHVDGKEILKGVTLTVELGKVHVLMGPNGTGKSSLANVLMGHPKYKVTRGKIILDGEDITHLGPTERARKGLFLSFQYPSEITGVTMSSFLRTAYNSLKNVNISVLEFHTLLKEKMAELNMDTTFSKRYLNEGFSGGEKKKAEILQMLVLQPRYAILDECDSGLDVTALKIVGQGIKKMASPERGILIITHYSRILNELSPDVVSIMVDGKIVDVGDYSLVKEIERDGYKKYGEVGELHAD